MPPEKMCEKCLFSEAVRVNPTDIHSTLICKHSPPQIVTGTVERNGQVGVQVLGSQWPPVPAQGWCHQFKAALLPRTTGDKVPDVDLN